MFTKNAKFPVFTFIVVLFFMLLIGHGNALALNNDALPDFVFVNGPDMSDRGCIQNGIFGVLCSNVDVIPSDAFDVALGDVNEDGNLDAVLAINSPIGLPNRICFGTGQGGFNNCGNISSDRNATNAVQLGDVNNDEHLDAIFANSGVNRICLGNGEGSLSDCSNISGEINESLGLTVGDVDENGNLDVVFANGNNQINQVCLGNGTGSFTCTNVSSDLGNSADADLGDVNGDDHLDIVFANEGNQRNRVCFGDGSGEFACTNVSLEENASSGVALGDLNGNGDFDVVFANTDNQPNQVCMGTGIGIFFCENLNADTISSNAVELSDVNGDLELDAVFANSGSPNQVCLGTEEGKFEACRPVNSDTNDSLGLAVSRLGDYCSSPARTVMDLRIETDNLDTSNLTIALLNERLDPVENALETGEFNEARDRLTGFISTAIASAPVGEEPDGNQITLDEADSLVCGATNLMRDIPNESTTFLEEGFSGFQFFLSILGSKCSHADRIGKGQHISTDIFPSKHGIRSQFSLPNPNVGKGIKKIGLGGAQARLGRFVSEVPWSRSLSSTRGMKKIASREANNLFCGVTKLTKGILKKSNKVQGDRR